MHHLALETFGLCYDFHQPCPQPFSIRLMQKGERQVGEVDRFAHASQAEVERKAGKNVEAAACPCQQNGFSVGDHVEEWYLQDSMPYKDQIPQRKRS